MSISQSRSYTRTPLGEILRSVREPSTRFARWEGKKAERLFFPLYPTLPFYGKMVKLGKVGYNEMVKLGKVGYNAMVKLGKVG